MNSAIVFLLFSHLYIMDSVKVINQDLLNQIDTFVVYNKEILEPAIINKNFKNNSLSYNFYDPISISIGTFIGKEDSLGFILSRKRSNYFYQFYKEIPPRVANYILPCEYFIYKDRLIVLWYYKKTYNSNKAMAKIRKEYFQKSNRINVLWTSRPINHTYYMNSVKVYNLSLWFVNGKCIEVEWF